MEKNTTRILFAVTKSLGEAGQLTTEGTMESEKMKTILASQRGVLSRILGGVKLDSVRTARLKRELSKEDTDNSRYCRKKKMRSKANSKIDITDATTTYGAIEKGRRRTRNGSALSKEEKQPLTGIPEEEESPKKVEQKTNKEAQQKQEPTSAVPAPSATTFKASDFLPSGEAEEEEEPEEESQNSQPVTTFRFKAAHFTPSDPLNAWDEADSSSSAAAPPPPEVPAASVSSSDKEQGKSTEALETERSESDTANTVIHMPSRMPKVIVDSTESTGTDPDTSDTVQEMLCQDEEEVYERPKSRRGSRVDEPDIDALLDMGKLQLFTDLIEPDTINNNQPLPDLIDIDPEKRNAFVPSPVSPAGSSSRERWSSSEGDVEVYYKLSDEDNEEPTKDWAEIENKKNTATNKQKQPNHADTNESETEEEDNKEHAPDDNSFVYMRLAEQPSPLPPADSQDE
ncbi:hypothetical protein WR25_01878 [Diploscapter pachys]|uniref:Uncharacterized protein n=1 Tax=Diploscapter pachys TaxID=2018661 RepID=A0A2A2KW18_9BILA|nr:hypothetical protein WR25_01878 [Diploscapter pachys]